MSALTMTLQLSRAAIESLPNYKKRGVKEWSSVCPNCGGDPARDSDRFRFWPDDGNYWCRQCGLSGFVSGTNLFTVTPEIKARMEAQRAENDRLERERRRTAIQSIQAKRNDLIYHKQLIEDIDRLEWLYDVWGITFDLVEAYHIGYCRNCPTYPDSDSYTIPFYANGELVNLRHRLLGKFDGGKYRPEIAGLETCLFNADVLNDPVESVLLVEGEFKAIYLSQFYNVVSVSGITQFKPEWGKLFNTAQIVLVCFDPEADEMANKTGQMLAQSGNEVSIIDLPHKPDDFFHIYGGDTNEFNKFLRFGRKL